MSDKIDLEIMRRDIRVSREAFDGTNRPLDMPVRIWVDEAEKLTNEVERLRAVLEQYADTANWVGHEWRGPTTNGWVLAARAL